MHNIIIYIGTSARDLYQYTALVNSIRAYNVDNIPVYTCVNDGDIEQFRERFADYDITFIKDSDVYNTPVNNPWYKQQLIKMNFWKLGISKYVLQMDSDSFFIRNFRVSDFLINEEVPYTVMHEHKELKEFFARHNLHNSKRDDNGNTKIVQGFGETSDKIKQLFGTENRTTDYDFGHTPLIINTKVWDVLEKEYIKPNNLTYESLLEYAGNDQQWYGETLLAFETHPIFPKENLFKVFHYPQNFTDFFRMDKLSDLRYNYYGICLQSNWCKPNTQEFNKIYNEFFTDELIPKMFNGQFGEDRWILENIELPTHGTVVDVGADQPIHGSNTYFFEKYLGWKSICIDGDSRTIPALNMYRKNVVSQLVGSSNGIAKFYQHPSAGISHISEHGNIEVPIRTLNSILEEHNFEDITLLDVDVEGHELEVFAGLDWNKYHPKIVIVEFVSPAGGDISKRILEFFEQIGNYKLVHTTQANMIYVRQ
jgi:FkbM family methyltransferase